MPQKNDFSQGTIPRAILNLALPMTLAQLINVLYNVVDRIYIGHLPNASTLALTGLGLTFPVITIITAFANLFGMGGAPLCSIARGKGDHARAKQIMGNSFSLLLISGILLTVLCFLFKTPILYLFGASENTISYATAYMNIYAIGTIFVQITLGMNTFITAQGKAITGMMTVLIGAVANIILDPIFIFGMHMGVRGAALATVISQALSCIWVLSFLSGKKTLLRIKKENIMPGLQLVPPCVALGASMFVMQASESVISVCFNSSLLKYGGDIAVGAMTILTSVMQFAMLPLQGIAQGAQPITSYNYGAKKLSRVKQSYKILLCVCVIYSVVLWAIIMAFPQVFAKLFTTDAALIDFTAKALRIYCRVLFVFGIQIACQMTFVSIGNAPCSIIVAILRKFILLIPLIYILPHVMENKTNAVYMAEPVADIIAVSCTLILFLVQFRKSLRRLT